MNVSAPKPYFGEAPAALYQEFVAAFGAASRAQKPDALGRLDWQAVNREMIAWLSAKGYAFP